MAAKLLPPLVPPRHSKGEEDHHQEEAGSQPEQLPDDIEGAVCIDVLQHPCATRGGRRARAGDKDQSRGVRDDRKAGRQGSGPIEGTPRTVGRIR